MSRARPPARGRRAGQPRRIGITGTCPVEVLVAAGARVLDLNNAFIADPQPERLLDAAHRFGFAPTQCAWTRGMFGAVLRAMTGQEAHQEGEGVGPLDGVVVVGRGDCTQNLLLADLFPLAGLNDVHLFAFPPLPGRPGEVREAVERLADWAGTDWTAVNRAWEALLPLRWDLGELERATWERDTVTGLENHLFLVRSTDLGGDLPAFRAEVAAFLREIAGRSPLPQRRRVAVFGVPTIRPEFYPYLEARDARVVLNEVQRDFAQLDPAPDLPTQYASRYAYAYSVHERLAAFLPEVARRRVEGVVVYRQSFCHHNVEVPAVRRALAGLPLVELEGDGPGELDQAQRLRLDTFLSQMEGVARPRRTAPRREGDGARDPATPPARALREALLGLDLGSRRSKLLLQLPDGRRARHVLDTVPFLTGFLERHAGALSLSLPGLRAVFPELDAALERDPGLSLRACATGYGRYAVHLEGAEVLPEIQAHSLGALAQGGPQEFVLVDLGGQDVKVIHVSRGQVQDFTLNDKCAAGSGRYLENMARLLGADLERFLEKFEDPVALSATCATFGETEVVTRLVQGASVDAIAAGVNRSIVLRLVPTLARFPQAPLLLSGGAAGPAIRRGLEAETGRPASVLPDPVFNGALGCVDQLSRAYYQRA
jgi:predicted CoA-substrate-specific enzyme activase